VVDPALAEAIRRSLQDVEAAKEASAPVEPLVGTAEEEITVPATVEPAVVAETPQNEEPIVEEEITVPAKAEPAETVAAETPQKEEPVVETP
jgi:hypothetical protein